MESCLSSVGAARLSDLTSGAFSSHSLSDPFETALSHRNSAFDVLWLFVLDPGSVNLRRFVWQLRPDKNLANRFRETSGALLADNDHGSKRLIYFNCQSATFLSKS